NTQHPILRASGVGWTYMLRPYQRRAFLLFALAALEPATATAAHASDPDSLWDILSRAETTGTATPPHGAGEAALEPATPRRVALGPVPGFTLPTTRQAGADNDSIFTKKKPKRGGFLGSLGDWFERMEAATGTKIHATGHHTTS